MKDGLTLDELLDQLRRAAHIEIQGDPHRKHTLAAVEPGLRLLARDRGKQYRFAAPTWEGDVALLPTQLGLDV